MKQREKGWCQLGICIDHIEGPDHAWLRDETTVTACHKNFEILR